MNIIAVPCSTGRRLEAITMLAAGRDNSASLGGGLPRLMSTVMAEGTSDETNGHLSVTKVSLLHRRHWLRFVLGNDTLHIYIYQIYMPRKHYLRLNECLSGFQPWYMEGTAQVPSSPVSLQSHPVMGLVIMTTVNVNFTFYISFSIEICFVQIQLSI